MSFKFLKISILIFLSSILLFWACSDDDLSDIGGTSDVTSAKSEKSAQVSGTVANGLATPLPTFESDVKTVNVNGEEFSVIDRNTDSQHVVLLLHGFPDDKSVWGYQIRGLSNDGYRVIAPDLRGSGNSPLTTDVTRYGLSSLSIDVFGILAALGVTDLSTVTVIGHDFGSALGWILISAAFDPANPNNFLNSSFPSVFENFFNGYIAMSVGIPNNSGFDDIAQRSLNWYYYLFLQAGLAEDEITANNWAFFREFLASYPDLQTIIDRYEDSGYSNITGQRFPLALTTGLNWYRANFNTLISFCMESNGAETNCVYTSIDNAAVPIPLVTVPVLGIWSTLDEVLLEDQMLQSQAFVPAWSYKTVNAGHWFMLERPGKTNSLIREFVSSVNPL